ncbi:MULTISPECIES: PTS transporter subunit EIIC [Pseudonocardia]|uniref:PTS system glucose-specific EIICB component n=2 Tax=Pseudonocardia TaxID=1847 RepID=A0A1Y2N143_PSEAH|nr:MULTISPECIES: PTS transporter subunit EIIC [Pseudonocardia]OSY41175.1 PTS system glucose-specific EIICB component [Pseudonocardia autotrophica]TDN76631.1 PTS system N-acetylglucosamine-specific IIC component (Glc family) [Pseudonocardia autotrophica]BBG00631.1 PTS glucose transporter subunit IIBC [Pseudonocardia autotrophica]GEC28015.1 PTS glucose transporter subunit IIBC [Pseudonocardia saturnea]
MSAVTSPSTSAPEPVKRRAALAGLQRLGRSLMLPIAVLPAAGLLLRLGQDDLLGGVPGLERPAEVLAAAGGALFDNLPMIFALGIAIGWARKADGSTALAALVGYLVLDGVFTAMSPMVLPGVLDSDGEQAVVNFGVLGGIVAGLTAALLWQRFHRTTLPTFLGFFNGRRLVPILTAGAMMVIAALLSLIYPIFNAGLTGLGDAVAANAVVGGGVFGVVNRLLLPLGLHHIVNSVVWFIIGDFEGAHGDLNRFFAGDPTAGVFMTGFFPIMMFALPAAALAIWHEARPERRKLVGGIMVSVALTSFVTGITEPLEYAFVYVAWPLYLIHALLTGTSLALVNALDIHSGFTFSAGAIDYVLNFGQSTRPLWLIPIGLVYAAVYYLLFRFVIRRWNLRTPGREDEEQNEGTEGAPVATAPAGPARGERSGSADPGTPASGATGSGATDTARGAGPDTAPDTGPDARPGGSTGS